MSNSQGSFGGDISMTNVGRRWCCCGCDMRLPRADFSEMGKSRIE